MSLATYKSQFVAVGGYDLFNRPSNKLFKCNKDLKWHPLLPSMTTERCGASSISTTSPEVLVVAGGHDANNQPLEEVEVLFGDHWHSVAPLPIPPSGRLTSACHHDQVLFTDTCSRWQNISRCNISSLISSGSATSTCSSPWKLSKAPHQNTITISYSTRLVNINKDGTINGYCTNNQLWLEVANEGDSIDSSSYTPAIALPTGHIVRACIEGVFIGKLKVSLFNPDSEIQSDVLLRLGAVMGIDILHSLASHRSKLCAYTLTSYLRIEGGNYDTPSPVKQPAKYAQEIIRRWHASYAEVPTWFKLFELLNYVGLIGLRQQIETFLKGDDIYIQAYHHFISTNDVLEMLFLKFLFLGAPRQGKTTARRRLMGEIINLESAGEKDKPQASTGTVECGHDMIVQNLTDTTTVITEREWSAIHSLTDEARMLFHNFVDNVQSQSRSTSIQTSSPPLQPKSVGQSTSAIISSIGSYPTQTQEVNQSLAKKFISKLKIMRQSQKYTPKFRDIPEISDIFEEVTKMSELWKDVKHSFRAYLRMEDTGGQPELMDMLPALTIGPGLFLLFFSFECDLKSNFQIYYETSTGKTTQHEESTVTLEEMLLSSLSSISCSNSLVNNMHMEETSSPDMQHILESSKSVAYIVGTHRDKVLDEYVDSFDKQLQQVIRDTDFFDKGVVQFFSEDKLIIPMNNMKGGKEEFNKIREVLEKAMQKHFKKLKIPAMWLLFSLCLRMRDVRTASMKICLELSRSLNMTPDETKVALWFLHHHAGVMMYFPNVSGLEDLVIIDIQVVFDSITSVILKAMSFDRANQAKAEKFRSTGQFSLKDLSDTTAEISGDLISPLKLVALLEYLHIVARIISTASSTHFSEDEDIYIMPCVLRSADKTALDAISKDESRPLFIAPLRVRFVCGFVPIGVFPAMTASFIGNSLFILKEKGMMKNLVQFHYGSGYALVTFLAHPKSYEIVISHLGSNCESHKLCTDLRRDINTTFEKVSSRMNYRYLMDYQFGFKCPTHSEEEHVCVVDKISSSPQAMLCLQNLKDRVFKDMKSCHKVWFGEPQQSTSGNDITESPSLSTGPDLTCAAIMQLLQGEVPFSEAENLGMYLEIKRATIKDLIFQKDPRRMMAAVMDHWLEYDQDPSWSKLAEAVESCGYKVTAEKIRSEHSAIVTATKSQIPS